MRWFCFLVWTFFLHPALLASPDLAEVRKADWPPALMRRVRLAKPITKEDKRTLNMGTIKPIELLVPVS